nr:MAG TPA: hypothetical protein [Caudoviricetes sp.]
MYFSLSGPLFVSRHNGVPRKIYFYIYMSIV